MPRFFLPAGALVGDRATITGTDAVHLARSLRARVGERIVVVDDAGREHGLLLDVIEDARVEGTVEWSRPATGEPELRLHVIQALLKEGMDAAIEAMSEAGVSEIWPVTTERTVSRPDPQRAGVRVERWRTIAREAAGLAGRGGVPTVHEVRPLADALGAIPEGMRVVALSVHASPALAELRVAPQQPAAVVVGPEGGLGPEDLATLAAAGAEEAHLGPRVLRARLAGVVAVTVLLDRAGELHTPVARAPLTVLRNA